jgi:hydroxyacylglutathione hydrolase
MGVFTGDFVFVGDVGRPDLLEKAAGVRGTMEAAARQLFRSLQAFRLRPDWLQLWPGHGAGSACGKSLGAVPQTTLGYEKQFNWAFGYTEEEGFVQAVLAGQPEPPKYFAEMKRINRQGPRVLGGFGHPPRLPAERLAAVLPDALVVDLRSASAHARERIPGTINVPLNRAFPTWAGWLVPFDRDFYLLVDDERCPACMDQAVRDLAMVGLDRIAGWFGADAVASWRAAGRPLETIGTVTATAVREGIEAGGMAVLDVRGRSEWEAGHIPSVPNIPVGHLTDRLGEVPTGRPLAVLCESGSRSAIAASVLRASGFADVVNFKGGFTEWQDAGYPVETEEPAHV